MFWLTIVLIFSLSQFVFGGPSPNQGMVHVPAGLYQPFFKEAEGKPIDVKAFWIDEAPVTNRDYQKFVKAKPEWRKSKAKKIFSDFRYLQHWKSNQTLKNSRELKSPVTNVSWFAANAYCRWKEKDLPTVEQWEYAAFDNGRNAEKIKEQILAWYSNPNPKVLPVIKGGEKNGFGIYDLHRLIWEWTLDFDSSVMAQESRTSGSKENNLFCGGASLAARDAGDYAAFMRSSFRTSLKANYCVANLGFRCVRN